MIHSISSDLPSFKGLEFRRGLNVLLADKSKGASDRQSRNGAGKTSLVELVHFLFAADPQKDNIFLCDALREQWFEAQVDIGGATVTIARTGAKRSRIRLSGDTSRFPIVPEPDLLSGKCFLSNKEWQATLGALLFDLPLEKGKTGGPFGPSFRSMFPYFARRQVSGGFQRATQHSSQQQPWNQQVSLSYLLGLDSTVPQRFQEVRRREQVMKGLRKAAREGDLGKYFGTVADLRTGMAIAEAGARRLREQVEGFTVVPEYAKFEREASEITRRVSDLNDENTADRELILQLRASTEQEVPPATDRLDNLYREAGVILSDSVGRHLLEVEAFHKAIIENRRSHLASEIQAAEERITARDRDIESRDVRRAQLMRILQSGRALEHYASLQDEASRVGAEAAGLRERLKTAEEIESTKAQLEIERAQLVKSLQDDHHERRAMIEDAILIFEELSNSLYERAGNLTISATPNGPILDVRIDAQRSKGITNMQMFCFDLMLVELTARRGLGPGFLVHDSHLFDGVDERQVAKALQLGADRADEIGFQYIVTLNSDALPIDGFRKGFDIGSKLIDPRLTDATESGGLFGIPFN